MRKGERDNGWAVRDRRKEEEMKDKGKGGWEEYQMREGRDGKENEEVINSRGNDN